MRMRIALFLNMTVGGHVMVDLGLAKAKAILHLVLVVEAKTWCFWHVT